MLKKRLKLYAYVVGTLGFVWVLVGFALPYLISGTTEMVLTGVVLGLISIPLGNVLIDKTFDSLKEYRKCQR